MARKKKKEKRISKENTKVIIRKEGTLDEFDRTGNMWELKSTNEAIGNEHKPFYVSTNSLELRIEVAKKQGLQVVIL